MKFFASKLYQRVTNLGFAFVLAVSSLAVLTPVFLSQSASALVSTAAYTGIPEPQPSAYSSLGYEATSTSEFGDHIQLAGSNRHLDTVTVSLTNWACGNDYVLDGTWIPKTTTDPCTTEEGATFAHDITLNLYTVGSGNTVGSVIASKTQSVNVPFRPSADPVNCTGGDAGKWFDGTTCNNGYAFDVTFDFTDAGVTLPTDIIAAIAYNTADYGVSPIHQNGPYNSLNVSLAQSDPTTGIDPDADSMFWDTTYPGYTAGLKTDTGWSPYHLAINVETSAIQTPTLIAPTNNTTTTDTAFTNTWTKSDGATVYEYRTSNTQVDATTLGAVIYSDDSSSSNYDLTGATVVRHNSGTPEANYYWQVRAGDQFGNWSDWSAINKVTVDTTAPSKPVLALPSNGSYLTTNDFDFDWNDSTDATAVTYEFQSSQDPSRDSNGVLNGSNIWQSGPLPSSNIHSSGAPDGAWFYQVRAKDAAGTYSQWSDIWAVIIDTVKPTATLVFPTPGPTATSFDVQFSEDVKASEATNPANYFLNNWPDADGSGDLAGDATVTYNSTSHKATVTFTNPGWYVSAEQEWGVQNIHDLAGNVLSQNPTTAYSTPLINPTAPGTPTTTTPTNTTSINWTWGAATDPTQASGIKGYYYVLKQGSTVIVSSTFTTSNSATTVVPGEGEYTLTVYAIDNAGNDGESASGSVEVDTTAPVVTIDTLSPTTDTTPTITGTVDDVDATVTVTVNGIDYTATPNEEGEWTITIPEADALVDGTYTVEVTAEDAVGNVTTPAETASLVIDTTGPVLTVTPITTTGNQPTITGTVATDAVSLVVTIDGTPLVATITGMTWSAPVTSPLADGSHTVVATAKDALGNTTQATTPVTVTTVTTPTPATTTTTGTTTTTNNGQAVLGATTDDAQAASAAGNSDVEGASDVKNVADVKTTNDANIFGLAWYWWLLILAALAAITWWIIAAIRSRNTDNA